MALIALCGLVFCAVVVPAFFVRRRSRQGPTGRAHRMASGALRLGWGLVLVAFVSNLATMSGFCRLLGEVVGHLPGRSLSGLQAANILALSRSKPALP